MVVGQTQRLISTTQDKIVKRFSRSELLLLVFQLFCGIVELIVGTGILVMMVTVVETVWCTCVCVCFVNCSFGIEKMGMTARKTIA